MLPNPLPAHPFRLDISGIAQQLIDTLKHEQITTLNVSAFGLQNTAINNLHPYFTKDRLLQIDLNLLSAIEETDYFHLCANALELVLATLAKEVDNYDKNKGLNLNSRSGLISGKIKLIKELAKMHGYFGIVLVIQNSPPNDCVAASYIHSIINKAILDTRSAHCLYVTTCQTKRAKSLECGKGSVDYLHAYCESFLSLQIERDVFLEFSERFLHEPLPILQILDILHKEKATVVSDIVLQKTLEDYMADRDPHYLLTWNYLQENEKSILMHIHKSIGAKETTVLNRRGSPIDIHKSELISLKQRGIVHIKDGGKICVSDPVFNAWLSMFH